MDPLVQRFRRSDDLESTLRRIAEGARLVGVAWFALLGLVALIQHGERVENPAWVVVPISAAVTWGLISLVAARRRPDSAISPLAIAIDAVIAGFALFAPWGAGIESVLFYGGLPLIAVAVAAVRSRGAAWGVAGVLVLVVLSRTGVDDFGDLVGSISQVVTYAAGAFIFTWVVRVLRSSETERRLAADAAARAEERATISRHLHDSVLQTLALMQRNAHDPSEVVALSRRQERELREWLYGTPRSPDSGFVDAVRSVASQVEEDYRVSVDVVSVGDAPMSPAVEALVAAGREAMINAATHAGVEQVAVYAEVVGEKALLFVRDRGVGFDPEAVPADRRGIAGSIRQRLQETGGAAEVRTAPGRGTEWRMEARL